jgi:hypothetical protein
VGFAFTTRTLIAAAASNNAALLQWLLEQGCPQNKIQLCATTACYGHTSILSLLQQRGLLPEQQHLSTALQLAGAYGRLTAAQWLRQRGAEWPPVLKYEDKPWTGAVLEWARAEGCTAPTEVEAAEDEAEGEEEEEEEEEEQN